jgi:hypothetical protein
MFFERRASATLATYYSGTTECQGGTIASSFRQEYDSRKGNLKFETKLGWDHELFVQPLLSTLIQGNNGLGQKPKRILAIDFPQNVIRQVEAVNVPSTLS